MAGLHFDVTGDNLNFLRKLEETKRGVAEAANFMRDQSKGMDSTFNSVSFGDTLKKQIYESSQSVNNLTSQIIKQKAVIKDVEQDVRTLGEAYRKAGVGTTKGNALFADYDRAKGALQEEKAALFDLQTQQAQARLSVRKLKDEYSLYQKEGQNVVESNNNMALSFKKTLAAIGGIAAIKQFGSEVLKIRGQFQQLDVAFTTLLQSKEKANALMAQMVQTAAKTPFNLTELATGAKQLVAYGFASEGVNDTLIRLGNIASGLSLPLERLTYLYGTTMTQGRLYKRDLNQFTTSGIPMLQGLADMFGITTEEVNKMVTAGKIGFPEVQKVIENMTNEGGKFYNLMEEQSKTITGKISNLGDAWDVMLNKIGQSSEAVINNSIDGLKYLIENYEQVGKILVGLIATYGAYKTATITYYTIAKTYGIYDIATKELQFVATMKNVTATKAMTIQQALLNKTMLANPYILVTTLLVGTAAAMWALHDSTTSAEASQKNLTDTVDELIDREEKHKSVIEDLINTANDEKKSTNDRNDAMKSLILEYPSIIKKYIDEEGHLKNIIGFKREIAEMDSIRSVAGLGGIANKNNEYVEFIKQVKSGNIDIHSDDKLLNRYKSLVQHALKSYNGRSSLTIDELLDFYTKRGVGLQDKYNRTKTESKLSSFTDQFGGESDDKLNELLQNRKELLKQFTDKIGSIYDSAIKDYVKKTDIESQVTQIEGIQNGRKGIVQNKSYWETQKKEAETKLEALSDIEAAGKKGAALKNQINEYDKKINAFSASKTSSQERKQVSAAEKLRQQQEKLTLLLDKQALEQSRSEEDMQNQVDQARIDVMKDGSEKTIEQMQLNHKKEMQQLEREKEDKLRKAIEDARALFDAQEDAKSVKNPKYVKQTFNASEVKLSDTQVSAFDSREGSLLNKQAKESQELLDDQKRSWDEYLSEYSNFQERKQALTRLYNNKIEKATSPGEKATLKKEFESKSKSLKLDEVKENLDFSKVFGNLDNLSTDTIDKLRDKLKEYIQKASKDLKPEDLKVLQDALQDMDFKVAERNPFGELVSGLKEYKSSMSGLKDAQQVLEATQEKGYTILTKYDEKTKQTTYKLITQKEAQEALINAENTRSGSLAKMTKAANSIGDKGQQVVSAGKDICDMLGNFGVEVPEAITGALDGMGQVMEGLSSIDLTSPFSAITGSVKILTGLGNAIASIFNGEKRVLSEETIRQYEGLISIIDELIDRQKELIATSDSASAQIAADEAKRLLNKQVNSSKSIGTEWLNSYNDSKHTVGYNLEKDLSGYSSEIEKAGLSWKKIYGSGRMEGLFSLTPEELKTLQKEVPDAWAKIDDKTKGYLQNIIDSDKKLKDIDNALNESLTGVSFDSLVDNFKSALSDMNSSAEDFAEDFEQYMMNAIINSFINGDEFKKKLEDWHKKFAEYSKSNNEIDANEKEELKKEWEAIVQEGVDYRNGIMETMGFDSSESSSQSSTQKGFTAMSQDSADELNGRFTALQMSGESIKNSMLSMLSSVNVISTSTYNNERTLLEIRNIALMSNSYLDDIAGYQKKIVNEFGNKLDSINSGIKQFNSR